jgi:hypothetical protein
VNSYSMPGAAACVPHVRLAASSTAVCGIQLPGARKLCWPGPLTPSGLAGPREVWGAAVAEVCDACAVTLDGALACGGEGINAPAVVTGRMGEFVSVTQPARAAVCALRSNGSFACFNTGDLAPLPPPAGAPSLLMQLVCDGGAGGVDDSDASCCGLLQNGSAVCWAALGSSVRSEAGPFSLLAMGGGIMCGILLGSSLPFCWPTSGAGTVLPPPQVPLSALSVGGASAVCGVALSDGSVVCWQGTGSRALYFPVSQGTIWVELAASAPGFVCVLSGSGTVECASVNGTARAAPPRLVCPNASPAPPGLCVFAAATAADVGRARGVGTGDTVVVKFSVDVNAQNCAFATSRAGVDSQLNFSSPLGANYAAVWETPARVVVTITNATGVDVDSTRIGALSVALTASCVGPISSSESGGWSLVGVPLRVGGSWGAWPAPVLLAAIANDTGRAPGVSTADTITLSFDIETDRPALGGQNVFSAGLGITTASWATPRTLIVTVASVIGAAPSALTRIGALAVVLSAALGIVSRDRSSATANTRLVVAGEWGNAIASVTGAPIGSLETSGGQGIIFQLAAAIGAGATALPVSVSCFDGGAFSYHAVGCAFSDDGATVACETPAGVGAGLSWQIVSIGVHAAGGPPATYAPPALMSVSPAVVPTDYAGALVVFGREFGSVELNAVDGLWLDTDTGAGGAQAESFLARDCVVNSSYTVQCGAPSTGVRGSALLLRLRIGGQDSLSASLSTLPPAIAAVELVHGPGVASSRITSCGANGTALCTRGGQKVRLTGQNFGRLTTASETASGAVMVECTTRGGGSGSSATVFVHSSCVVVAANFAIECMTSPGFGGQLQWHVTVLGVTSEPFKSVVAYAAPSVLALDGPLRTQGSVHTLRGKNFGTSYAAVVWLILDGGQLLTPLSVSEGGGAESDDVITFLLPRGVGAAHTLAVVVGGQVSAPVVFAYDAPVVTAVGLLSISAARCVRE